MFGSNDPGIQSVEECERLRLKIVAAEHLRDSFVGVYDIKASDAAISGPQRHALERLAIARFCLIPNFYNAKDWSVVKG